MQRSLNMLFAVVAYAIFFATFLYLVAFVGNLPLVPITVDRGPAAPTLPPRPLAGVTRESAERIDVENARLIAHMRVSDEGQRGLAAFLDKRAPDWVKE